MRPVNGHYEILSGHHRGEAAEKENLDEVPCWVRELDDDAAYMLLATSNAQGELSPLERGMHALHSGMDVKGYAATVGRPDQTVYREMHAAKVAASIIDVDNLSARFSQLVEIHAAPQWLWQALVKAMLPPKPDASGWTVEQTRMAVRRVKDAAEPPEYLDLADAIVSGDADLEDGANAKERETELAEEIQTIARRLAAINRKDPPAADYGATVLRERIAADKKKLTSYSDVLAYFKEIIAPYRTDLAVAEGARAEYAQRRQTARQDAARRYDYVSLEEWKTFNDELKNTLLDPDPRRVNAATFNAQKNTNIEWAAWSWNPITGCLHDCPYCYARDIAQRFDGTAAYPHGFAPTLRPRSLLAPVNTELPQDAESDVRLRNVFAGSMADIFGRWVPTEWIEAVLSRMRSAPQWNFLCLTKFPKRMAEFDIPPNCWMGTTVDMQKRVAGAEAAFARIGAGVKWLSVEPMLEPLKFSNLDRFDWIVIGGASRSSETPMWKPPVEWVFDLYHQAREAGLKVYMKSNLFGFDKDGAYQGNPRILELPFDAAIIGDSYGLPEALRYLQGKQDPEG